MILIISLLHCCRRKRRPHILKIDVEGHDYEVLMSFVLDSTPVSDLPLLIEFEVRYCRTDILLYILCLCLIMK